MVTLHNKRGHRRARPDGFVLVTVLMVLILFTGASVTTLYAVTASIKGTGYMRHRVETFEWADGGLRTVYAYMCDRRWTQEADLAGTNLLLENYMLNGVIQVQYRATLQDLRVTKRKVPGFSGDLLGREILITSRGWELSTSRKGSVGEMLVFIAQGQVTGYGNE